MRYRKVLLVIILSSFAGIYTARATDSIPPYSVQEEVGGTYRSVGSDTLAYLMSFWIIEFKRWHPSVRGMIEAEGSATAPPALIDGRSDFGPMSRLMNERERATFVQKFGYEPTVYRVAQDALAVYTSRDNPILGLTLPQVDAIFSTERRCGYYTDVNTWRDVGVGGDLSAQPVALFGRNLLSGTRAFFAEHALCKGSYKPMLKMQVSSAEVVRQVGTHPNAIGYSGIGYKNDTVRAVPLTARDGNGFAAATEENVRNGRYPLSRYLYIYINQPPAKRLAPLQREFLRMVLSQRGQWWVMNDGFIPLDPAVLAQERARLD